jgi:phosphatidate cytidylyltransferase
VSDDIWRRDDGDDEFDEPTGEVPVVDDSAALRFGPDDTGPLPHWTEPPTGEMPLFAEPTSVVPTAAAGSGAGEGAGGDDDVDVWESFTTPTPVWRDDSAAIPAPSADPSYGDAERPAVFNEPSSTGEFYTSEEGAVRRREPTRISIGTSMDESAGRPTPGGRRRAVPGEPPRRSRPEGARPSAAATAAPPMPRDLPTAVAVGFVLAAVFVGALLWKPVAVLAIIVLVLGFAGVEFFDRVTDKGYRPVSIVGIGACVGGPLAVYWVGERGLPLVIAFAFLAAAIAFVGAESVQSGPLPNSAITAFGVVWIGLLGSYAALIVSASNVPGLDNVGTDTLFLLAIGVVANDIGAYFVGSAAGRTPLRAWISPNKTVEGLIGGSIATIAAVMLASLPSDTWTSVTDRLLLAVTIAVLAPLGDLFESAIKRNLDVKDFGTLVRGHGGVLDRFDGFLFVLPAVWYLLITLEPWTAK